MFGMGRNSRSRRIILWIVGVSLGVVLLGLVGYALKQSATLRSHENRVAALEEELSRLSTDQRLLTAMVAAGDIGTAGTDESKPASESESVAASAQMQPGARRTFGAVRSVSEQQSYGWVLEVDPSEYLTGTPAFSAASSMGRLTNSDGSFILDTSVRTTKLKLLKDTKVTVTSWPGGGAGVETSLSATKLAAVLPGGSASDSKWAKALFWFEVRDGVVLSVVQQTVK